MVDTKISGLPTNSAPLAADEMVMVNSGVTKKMAVSNFIRSIPVGTEALPGLRFGTGAEAGFYYDSAGAELHGIIAGASVGKFVAGAFVAKALQIDNPAQTFQYILSAGAILADRTIAIPLLTGNDELTMNSFAQTLINKTLTSPIINVTSDADGDVYYRAAGAFARLAKGTALQVLAMNAGATAPEWVAPSAGGGGDFLADGSVPMTGPIDEAQGIDIASAATTDIGAGTGNLLFITGTTTITGLGTVQAGVRRELKFTGILTLTHNATSLILPTMANITTAVDDRATFISLGGGNWICTNYQRADGTALVGGGSGDILADGSVPFTGTIAGITPASTTDLVTKEYADEVARALDSAYLQFNTANTVDIVFPYVFSDGSTWATISGKSTTQTGKTNTNIYWMGVYYDGSAGYSKATAPVAGDITIATSASNSTEPTRPANGIKIGTYLHTIGNAGGDVDITDFFQRNNRYAFNATRATIAVGVNGVTQNISLVNEMPPTAIVLKGFGYAQITSATVRFMDSIWYMGNSGLVTSLNWNLRADSNLANDLLIGVMTLDLPISVAQIIRVYGFGQVTAGTQNLDAHTLQVTGYEE